jgi:hypothetical protein
MPEQRDRSAVNFNAQMQVISNGQASDTVVTHWVNANSGRIQKDFCHCFGVEMEKGVDGEEYFPGGFEPDQKDPNDPTKWVYQGPLINRIGRVEVAPKEVISTKTNKPVTYMNIKRFFCALGSACHEQHSEDLLRKSGA